MALANRTTCNSPLALQPKKKENRPNTRPDRRMLPNFSNRPQWTKTCIAPANGVCHRVSSVSEQICSASVYKCAAVQLRIADYLPQPISIVLAKTDFNIFEDGRSALRGANRTIDPAMKIFINKTRERTHLCTNFIRFLSYSFRYCFTLISKFFASFLRSTCSLSVSV